MTEFAHQMALGGDGLQEIWDIVLKENSFIGGAIWMFQDQGILRRKSATVIAHPYAEHRDEQSFIDTGGNRGADGLTYSDRIPKTNYWQAQAVFAPVRVVAHQLKTDGTLALTLANYHDVLSLSGMVGSWQLFVDGLPTAAGVFSSEIKARSQGEVRIKLPSDTWSGATTAWVKLDIKNAAGHRVLMDSLPLRKPSWSKTIPATDRPATESWARWFIGGEKPGIRLRAGRSDGMLTANWTGRGVNAGKLWQPHLLAPTETGALQEKQLAGGLELSRKLTFARSESPGQSVSGIVRCTIPNHGPVRIDYDLDAQDATGIWLEAGVAFAAPTASNELHWIGPGPYPTYPGKNMLGRYDHHALHSDDLYFEGNRQDVGVALLVDPAGKGIAILPTGDGFDLSVERGDKGIIVGHNAGVSGVGSKFKLPEHKVEPAKTPKLSGSFQILPLASGTWPKEIEHLFGRDRQRPVPFHPYQSAQQ
jgi:beta-galactosidase